MAFNFLGTFTAEEVLALLAFAEDQLQDVEDRIAYLKGQITRVGWIQYELNEQRLPVSYTIEPTNSLLAKYVRGYHFYGGNLLDLTILSRGQWISFSQEDPDLNSINTSSAGSLQSINAQVRDVANLHGDDAVPAIAVDKIKSFMIPAIQAKREDYEFKLKKALDLADQYLEEIILLVRRANNGDETLANLREQIQYYLNDPEFPSAGLKPRV